MFKKTPLHKAHQEAHAKLVDFAGWEMPLHYGSQMDEHHKVRQDAGMFDVSHMCVVDISGTQAQPFLRYLLANDIAKLKIPGKALYSCMLNEAGGVIDDLIVYFLDPENYRLVVNAGTRDKDLAWLHQQAENFHVQVVERKDLAIIAIQGPNARAKADQALSARQREEVAELTPFQGIATEGFWVARTGYTGEDGYEIILPNEQAESFWQALLKAGVSPCGLGARDTLRLEAGLNLYGNDMDETTSPLESNLAWTVTFDAPERDFIGRQALLQQQKAGLKHKLVGLVLEERGVLRSHQKVVITDLPEGEITSGTFSPTIGKSIALARIPLSDAEQCTVEIRGKYLLAKIVKPRFVHNGKILV